MANCKQNLIIELILVSKNKIAIFLLRLMVLTLFLFCNSLAGQNITETQRCYYVSENGNDDDNGDKHHPWQTLNKINSIILQAGDSILLKGGDIFNGTLVIQHDKNNSYEKPVFIGSYGTGKAIINAANSKGIEITESHFIDVKNIKVIGSGRKEGNTQSGVNISYCTNVTIDDIDISGFQKAGLLVHSSSSVNMRKVHAHNNGASGIVVDGDSSKKECKNILIDHCSAENNPGDPTNFTNHSGNGIVVSQCTNLKIAYCTATNNGWDMPRIGNGPVGIWAWEADSVIIEHCISYRNKTSKGGEDGGGFDFDGGVTNSVIQYCLSYENYGSGIGLFQYSGGTPWYNNTIRYNISINDGLVSAAKAGIYIWNASYENKLRDCYIYNNTIYNSRYSAISYAKESDNESFKFYNNIFVAKDSIIIGQKQTGEFLGNNYLSLQNGFSIEGITTLKAWANARKQELLNGKLVGLNINPAFKNPDIVNIINPDLLPAFFNCKLPKNSILRKSGLNLKNLFSIDNGRRDFNGSKVPSNGIGASF